MIFSAFSFLSIVYCSPLTQRACLQNSLGFGADGIQFRTSVPACLLLC